MSCFIQPCRKALKAALALAFIAPLPLACDQAEADGDALDDVERRSVRFSGEELYLGIIFGQGEVAQRLPTVWGGEGNARAREVAKELDRETVARALDEAVRHAVSTGDRRGAATLQRTRESLDQIRLGEHPAERVDFDWIIEVVRRADPRFFDRFAADIQSGDHVRVREGLQNARDITTMVWEEVDHPSIPGDDHGILILVEIAGVYEYVVAWQEFWVKTGFDVDSLIYEELVIDEIVGNFGIWF